MDVNGLFDISVALPWVKNPWYLLDRGAPRAVLNVMKKRKISYHIGIAPWIVQPLA